jgi:hypothetical protein
MMAGGEDLEARGHELEEFARLDAAADDLMQVGRELEAEGGLAKS